MMLQRCVDFAAETDAVVDTESAFGSICSKLQIMGNHNNSHALLTVDILQFSVERNFGSCINACSRFIQKQDFRLVYHGAGKKYPLLLATAKLANLTMTQFFQLEIVQRLFYSTSFLSAETAQQATGINQAQRYDLLHANGEGTLHLHGVLRHVANFIPLFEIFNGTSVVVDFADSGGHGVSQHFQQGAFACTVGADDGDEVALGNVQIQLVEDPPITLVEA